jgi:multidrug efflux pump subunit AcrB
MKFKDSTVDNLSHATIVNQQGEKVHLSGLTTVDERRVPKQIQREDQQYFRMVSLENKGPYRFGDRFVDATIKTMPLLSRYLFDRSFHYFWLTESSQMSLLWIAVFAMIIVFMLTSSAELR